MPGLRAGLSFYAVTAIPSLRSVRCCADPVPAPSRMVAHCRSKNPTSKAGSVRDWGVNHRKSSCFRVGIDPLFVLSNRNCQVVFVLSSRNSLARANHPANRVARRCRAGSGGRRAPTHPRRDARLQPPASPAASARASGSGARRVRITLPPGALRPRPPPSRTAPPSSASGIWSISCR